MPSLNNFLFFEKYILLKQAKNKLEQTKKKYLDFIKSMYSIAEAEEKIQKLDEKIEKLNRKIEIGNLFVVDIVCIILFAFVGFQWGFQEYTDYYPIVSVSLAAILACGIFFNIHRNKIKFCTLQENLIKSTFNELTDPSKYYERLGVDTLLITLGKDLYWIADTENNGNLLPRLVALRKRLVDELGYIIPNIRLQATAENEPKEFDIWVRGKLVDKGEITEKPDYLDEADIITEKMYKAVIKYVDYIFSLSCVYKLTEYVKTKDEPLVEQMAEYTDSLDIRNILVGLIKKNRSIKDIEFIYQKIADYSRYTSDTKELTEKIKTDIDLLSKAGKDII